MPFYYQLELYLLLYKLNLYAQLSVYIYCTMTSCTSSRSLGLVMDLMELNKLNWTATESGSI